MDGNVLVLADITPEKMPDAVLDQHVRLPKNSQTVDDYKNSAVSIHVAGIIPSYTDYVKRTVWREY